MEGIGRGALVGVVGAGVMGAGIAQVAAMAGHRVRLHDAREGAAEVGVAQIRRNLARLSAKGKVSQQAADAAVDRVEPVSSLQQLEGTRLVIEAIVEDLQVKRALFAQLEDIVGSEAVLATNTSSISITAIGAGLQSPERLAGMHFFNPAPAMPLVEVISGLATASSVSQCVFDTAVQWGKTPVHARSTPGFIVNRIARPFYAEALRLLQEGTGTPATLDAVMRDCGGFRMGPFELMDLIGHDVNYAVTRSVFDAFYGDPRFQPSLIQLELVNAGRLGRKSGRGFYDYRRGAVNRTATSIAKATRPARADLFVSTPLGAALCDRLERCGLPIERHADPAPDGRVATVEGAVLFLTDGRTATERSAVNRIPGVVVVDAMINPAKAVRAAVAPAVQCAESDFSAVVGLLQAAGFAVTQLADSPGLMVMRTLSMLANEAADAVHQQVCSVEGSDLAMKGGVGYPLGPLEWAERMGAEVVIGVLNNLAHHYGEPRYRVSPLLRTWEWTGRGGAT